jgi:hypothetical protein
VQAHALSYHLPFGAKDVYVKEIMAADLGKLADLIRVCGFLMQTKVYLFWKGRVLRDFVFNRLGNF